MELGGRPTRRCGTRNHARDVPGGEHAPSSGVASFQVATAGLRLDVGARRPGRAVAGVGPRAAEDADAPLGARRGADPHFAMWTKPLRSRATSGRGSPSGPCSAQRRSPARAIRRRSPAACRRSGRVHERRLVLAVGDGDDEPRAIVVGKALAPKVVEALSVATAVQVEPVRAPGELQSARAPALDDRVEADEGRAGSAREQRWGSESGRGDDAGRVDRRRRRRRRPVMPATRRARGRDGRRNPFHA